MLRLRLQTARAVYPRPSSWRQTTSVTPPVPSDAFTPTTREIRNVRRLKPRRLRISPMRLGQRRAFQWRVVYGFPWVSDARPAQASIAYRNARASGPRRVR